MKKFDIREDDPNITTLAETLAEEIRVRLFEDEDGMDDLLMDMVAELVPAHLFEQDDIDQLEEIKDLAQKFMLCHLQVLVARVFAFGDWNKS